MSKKILRLSSNQVLKQISNSQITNKPSVEQPTWTYVNDGHSLLGLEKPCGLFNPIESDVIQNSDKDDELMMELLGMNFSHDDMPFIDNNNIENQLFNENMNPADLNNNILEPKQPNKKISKFSKKVQDLNMKINIPSRQVLTSVGSVESVKKLTPDESYNLTEISSDTEKMYSQFIQSIPTDQLELPIEETPAINYDLLDQFGTEENFEKLIRGFPSSEVTKLNDPFMNKDKLDHDYSINVKKRKFSEDSVFDDSMTNDSFSSSSVFTESFKSNKSKRTRGIYRADDVTNEEERVNYLERRKKNNISSKISRANKKKTYSEMDSKCYELDRSNKRLEIKIQKLEKVNKIIKEFLVEKFTSQNQP